MLNTGTTALMEALAAIESQIARHGEQLKELARRSPVLRQLPACIYVSIVSIVCAIKAPVPLRAEDGLDPLHLHCR
jgi:hypothetical protein